MTDKSVRTILMHLFFIRVVIILAVHNTQATHEVDCSHTQEQISSATMTPTCRRTAVIRGPLQRHHKHARLWMDLPSTLLPKGSI